MGVIRTFAGGRLWLPLIAATIAAAPAAGQVLGKVVDDTDGAGLPRVLIVASDTRGTELTRAFSNADGRFTLRLPVGGRYVLGMHAIGYQSLVGLEIVLGDDALRLEVGLRRDPVAVDPITVTATRLQRKLEAVGFYRREEAGFGRFIGPEAIAARTIDRLSDALRLEPSILFHPKLDGSNDYQISFRGTFRSGSGAPVPCEPTLVLDGMKMGDLGDLVLDNVAHPDEVLAVELYPRAHGAPVQWAGYDAGCGVIAIWTKRGEG